MPWTPPNEYKPKHDWQPFEDAALKSVWGLTDIHEIAEEFMCSPYNIITRARVLGLVPHGFHLLQAKNIEKMVQLFESGESMESVTSMYNLPSEIYHYAVVPNDADMKAERKLQEHYARNNKDQLDMFNTAQESGE